MSTSKKNPSTIRQDGPGASHEDATKPLEIGKPPADSPFREHSRVSGGGGEADSHHSHDPARKGGHAPKIPHRREQGRHHGA